MKLRLVINIFVDQFTEKNRTDIFLFHNFIVLHISELQQEFQYLSKSLGRDWPFFIRELELPESEIDMIRMDHRFTRDQIYQCLLAWQDTNKQTATKQRLISALREIERNDLAESMESGDYS